MLTTKVYTCLGVSTFKPFNKPEVTLLTPLYLHLEVGKRYYLLVQNNKYVLEAVEKPTAM